MNPKALKITVCLLIGLALFFGLDLPRFFLPQWSPLARIALDAGGQLLAYVAMVAVAISAAPLVDGRKDHNLHS